MAGKKSEGWQIANFVLITEEIPVYLSPGKLHYLKFTVEY